MFRNYSKRKEIAYFMRRLYMQNLTTTSGGNISLRIDKDSILITPSASDKARTKASNIVLMDKNGRNRTPRLKPSIETGMHLEIYAHCPHIKAIVHAHPPTATAFTAMNAKINTSLIAEAYAIIGKPVMAPYALMGSAELAKIVAESAEKSSVILLQNHGIVCIGKTLLEAFDKLEVLENAAKMTLYTKLMQSENPLNAEQEMELKKLIS